MFVYYSGVLFEGPFTREKRKGIKTRIDRWLKKNGYKEGEQKTVDWSNGNARRISLEVPADEMISVLDLVSDSEAKAPENIVLIDQDFEYPSPEEIKGRAPEDLDGEDSRLVHYLADLDGFSKDELAIVSCTPDIMEETKEVRLFLGKNSVRMEYTRGFSGEKLNRALYLYSQGISINRISKLVDLEKRVLYKKLYSEMGLPKIGPNKDMRDNFRQSREIVGLWKSGVSPTEIIAMGYKMHRVYSALGKAGLPLNRGRDYATYQLTGKGRDALGSLEEKDREILGWVDRFTGEKGRPPTKAELHADNKVGRLRLQLYVDQGLLSRGLISKMRIYSNKSELR